MSPRRQRRKPTEKPLGGWIPGVDRVEDAPDGEWVVRTLSGSATPGRAYRCPGCDHEIRAAEPHIVSWPNWPGGEEERRHWHTACWRNRVNRGPGRTRY